MIKRIEFNLRDTVAYINSASLTTMKLFMSTPPFVKINWAGLSTEEKYNTLMQVFEGCKEGVPIPENPKEFARSVMKNFGFNSWKKYAEEGKHCSIKLHVEVGQYEFTPMIYLAENNGLYGIKDGIECIPSTAGVEEIITTLERVLEKISRLAEEYYQKEEEEEESEEEL